MHPGAELSGAEACDPGKVWLERSCPVPELVELNHFLATIRLQELKYKPRERRHCVDCLGQQLTYHGVEGLVEYGKRVALQLTKKRSIVKIITQHQPANEGNHISAFLLSPPV